MPLGAFRLNSLARYVSAAVTGGWNILYSTYDSVTKDISANETQPTGIFFKPDGTKMFICGNNQNAVLEYTLSSAWDISTASYDSQFSVATEDTTPNDLFFKSDGLKMYVIGQGNDKVYQYLLSTAWDVSSASYSTEISVGTEDTAPMAVFFKSDGTKMYALGTTNDSVFQYSLSTAWDVSSASYDSVSFSVASQETSPTAMSFKPDGTRMFIAGSANDRIYEYTLSTAWDLSSASYDSVSFNVGAQSPTPTGIFFREDGTKFYVVDSGVNPAIDAVYQYTINEDPPSRTAKTITAFGNAQLDTSDKKFGTSSLLLDGTGDYAVVTADSDFALSGDFTIECFIKTNTRAASGVATRLLRLGTNSGSAAADLDLAFYSTTYTDNLSLFTNALVITGSIDAVTNTWQHVALARSGTSLKLFIDGVQSGSTYTTSTNFNTGTTTGVNIGWINSLGGYYTGWIDELRISTTARYTTGFTPPSTAFTNDSDTILLCHFDGTDGATVIEDDNF